jgi:hypothetical protein
VTVLPGVPRFLAASPASVMLDISTALGQRAATFRYELINGLTGVRLGNVTPMRTTIPVLTHNTQNTIVRSLTGITFGRDDTAAMNPITDRIVPYMVIGTPDGDLEFPLGRYMYDSTSQAVNTGGNLASNNLFDEMFIIDQQMSKGFNAILTPLFVNNISVQDAIARLLAPLVDAGLIRYLIEDSPLPASGSWAAGTSRASVLSDLCKQGAYFQPWFDNDGVLRIIRAFNPADVQPNFDFDATYGVIRDTISYTNDLLTAPNQYVVIDNSGTTTSPIVGTYDVPSTAPHSLANRGFYVPRIYDIQGAGSTPQANAMAATIAQQDIVYERTQLSTAPDPRHDSYDVILWLEEKWMEIAWSMQLEEGGPTVRTLRKAYQ